MALARAGAETAWPDPRANPTPGAGGPSRDAKKILRAGQRVGRTNPFLAARAKKLQALSTAASVEAGTAHRTDYSSRSRRSRPCEKQGTHNAVGSHRQAETAYGSPAATAGPTLRCVHRKTKLRRLRFGVSVALAFLAPHRAHTAAFKPAAGPEPWLGRPRSVCVLAVSNAWLAWRLARFGPGCVLEVAA